MLVAVGDIVEVLVGSAVPVCEVVFDGVSEFIIVASWLPVSVPVALAVPTWDTEALFVSVGVMLGELLCV